MNELKILNEVNGGKHNTLSTNFSFFEGKFPKGLVTFFRGMLDFDFSFFITKNGKDLLIKSEDFDEEEMEELINYFLAFSKRTEAGKTCNISETIIHFKNCITIKNYFNNFSLPPHLPYIDL